MHKLDEISFYHVFLFVLQLSNFMGTALRSECYERSMIVDTNIAMSAPLPCDLSVTQHDDGRDRTNRMVTG